MCEDVFEIDCPHGSKCCIPYSCEYCPMSKERECNGCAIKMDFLQSEKKEGKRIDLQRRD